MRRQRDVAAYCCVWQLSLLAKKCDYRQSLLVQIELMDNYTLRQLVWMDEFGKRKKPPQR